MIVKRLESPVYYRRKRQSLPGRGAEARNLEHNRSFEEYLLEAFQGEVVQKGKEVAKHLSPLTQKNLIKLSQL